MAEEQYAAYKRKWGYPPKQPHHLTAFAKKNNVKITWKQATQLIQKAPTTNNSITQPKNTEEKKCDKIDMVKQYTSNNTKIVQNDYSVHVTQLTAIGFNETQSIEALKANNGNLLLSIEMIMSDSDKIMSLGHRLKLLSKCIKNTKLEYSSTHLTEIALVEGYNESSYIMSQLKSLNNISINQMNQINTIINQVMPFDYQEFFKLFEATQQTAQRLKDKICWILLGPTGAGKSTSIHYFCGSHFKQGDNGSVIVNNMNEMLKKKDIKIGTNVTESCTRFIQAVHFDLSKYENDIEFTYSEPRKILLVDTPGFEDTAGPEVIIANGIGTIRALKKAKEVKVIITFKEAHLDYKFKIIRNLANNMGHLINNLEYELDNKYHSDGSAIVGFLTKSNYGIKNAKIAFSKAYDEQKGKDDNSNENALFKALIHKLGKIGPLYEIKIDVENYANNEKERLKIIKSLVEDTGYIKAPSETFTEFISESALHKLTQQIDINYNTIQNIFDNDVYFENPKYVKYIVYILSNIHKLKNIIRNAGGESVQMKLKKCMNVFQTKWNDKILKGNNILGNIDIKQCNINLLQNKLKQVADIKTIIKENIKVIKQSKYYKEYQLKDECCLNDGLYKCFDEIYKIIMEYLRNITCKYNIKSDDEDAKSTVENKEIELINNDNYNDKIIISSINKCFNQCFLLYKHTQQYKDDNYISEKIKELEILFENVIKDLKNILDCFFQTEQSQNMNDISKLMFMFSDLSTLHMFSIIMDKYLNNSNDDKSSKIVIITKTSVDTLKLNITNCIKHICKSYSLNEMSTSNDYIDVNTLLKSKLRKTDDEMRARENTLMSFCLWLNKLYDSLIILSDTNLSQISVFKELQTWLNNTQTKWIEWLCNSCIHELKTCNDLLINHDAESWKDVEKLLIECESLRKVYDVKNNTSQEYFQIVSEFDCCKTALAKEATQLIKGKNINYEKIIKITNELYDAGCGKESSEIKQIYDKLKQHLNDLKSKIESIVLSIEMSDNYDNLIVIEDTMKELSILEYFVAFMPNIKKDTNECYKILNDYMLNILNEIKLKYDLCKYSTNNIKILIDKLTQYLNIKCKIDTNICNDIIMKCEFKTLIELISLNKDKINKLRNKNELIKQKMEAKCNKIMEDIKKYEKLVKKSKQLLLDDDDDLLDEWLNKVGFESGTEIRNKLKESNEVLNKMCHTEIEEKERNINEINQLNTINNEVEKCLQVENDLMLLKPDKIVQYRMNNNFLQNNIAKLEKLLEKNINRNYIFVQKLSLYNTHSTLKFLNKCKMIKWNLRNKIDGIVISNKSVSEINSNVSQYLRAYGFILESNLNDLIETLAIKDVLKCDLNNVEYVNFIKNAVDKLTNCLREIREISNFDHQIIPTLTDDKESKQLKPLKLVPFLFTNHDIQLSVDDYINDMISIHKKDIMMNFSQFKIHRVYKLPVLYFICISMSVLKNERKNKDNTYYHIASQIDDELKTFCEDKIKQIISLFENGALDQLKDILTTLKKTADADKHGIAQKMYRNGVNQLLGVTNKLIKETKRKLFIEINKNNDASDQQILNLNKELKRVQNMVQTIYCYLYDQTEKDTIKNEEKALSVLLFNQLMQLMRSALQSAKQKDFERCEKRLDNISRFMDHNTQFYIHNVDNKNEQKEGYNIDNIIVIEFTKIRQQINEELNTVLQQVKVANKSLMDAKVFNPYNRLRLIRLHNELTKSQNEKFRELWDNIFDDIVNTIQNVFDEIKQRNNSLHITSTKQKLMTYSEQTVLIKKIEMSLSQFPPEMKELIDTMLKHTKQCIIESVKECSEEFETILDTHLWNQVARKLNEFQHNDMNFFQSSRKVVINKISNIYETFNNNMKTVKGFMDNIDLLDSYKDIGLVFTSLIYDNDNDNNCENNVIIIPYIQNILKQMYKDIECQFVNKCKDIKSNKYLKDSFLIIDKVLQNKHKLPQMVVKNIINASDNITNEIDILRSETNKTSDGNDELKLWFDNKVQIPHMTDTYFKMFVSNGYDTLNVVKLLCVGKLKNMGMNKQGHIDKIMIEVDILTGSNTKGKLDETQRLFDEKLILENEKQKFTNEKMKYEKQTAKLKKKNTKLKLQLIEKTIGKIESGFINEEDFSKQKITPFRQQTFKNLFDELVEELEEKYQNLDVEEKESEEDETDTKTKFELLIERIAYEFLFDLLMVSYEFMNERKLKICQVVSKQLNIKSNKDIYNMIHPQLQEQWEGYLKNKMDNVYGIMVNKIDIVIDNIFENICTDNKYNNFDFLKKKFEKKIKEYIWKACEICWIMILTKPFMTFYPNEFRMFVNDKKNKYVFDAKDKHDLLTGSKTKNGAKILFFSMPAMVQSHVMNKKRKKHIVKGTLFAHDNEELMEYIMSNPEELLEIKS